MKNLIKAILSALIMTLPFLFTIKDFDYFIFAFIIIVISCFVSNKLVDVVYNYKEKNTLKNWKKRERMDKY